MRLIDLISRQAAIDAMYMGCYLTPKDRSDLVKALERLPTIDAVPVKHGEWIVKGQDIFCSVCGEESAYTWSGASKFSNYCPNCGAKMDGGKDDGMDS